MISRGGAGVNNSSTAMKVKAVNKNLMFVAGGNGRMSSMSAISNNPVVHVESDGVSRARESDCETVSNEAVGFTLNESKNGQRVRRKRLREPSSPVSPSYAQIMTSSQSHIVSNGVKKITAATQNTRRVMIGHLTTSTLKASKNVNVAKTVYRISNIDACYTLDDLEQYIESLGVRVISCFERTSPKSPFAENKTFRVCILDIDKSTLLCDNNWSVGISIQKWIFKPKAASAEGVSKNNATFSVDEVRTDTSLKASTSVAADCSAATSMVL